MFVFAFGCVYSAIKVAMITNRNNNDMYSFKISSWMYSVVKNQKEGTESFDQNQRWCKFKHLVVEESRRMHGSFLIE